MPLSHAPGQTQCDFGEALVVIGGVEQKAHCFVIDLPHSDGCFVKAYPAETTEAFLDGHVSGMIHTLGGALARCEYIQRRENVIAVGNSGTGKTHVTLGLGLAACQRGMSVGFTTAAALVHEMMEARDERTKHPAQPPKRLKASR